jgi:DNA-directed RNA polymerase specialized sigma24 family protein
MEDKVNIPDARHNKARLHGLYAASTDFCRIFEEDMDRLYLLSLLLTADPEMAEECFVQGLDTSKSSNPVFKEWAQSWARRAIVQNAVRMIDPRPPDILPSNAVTKYGITQPAAVAAIVALPAFDRFAYVLLVLEGYSLHECALLLNCRRNELITARMRALQQVVQSVERGDAVAAIDSGNQPLRESGRFNRLSQLAATA